MTPMTLLKPQLDQLSEAMAAQFKESNLNKAKPRIKFVQTVDDEYHNTFPEEDAGYTIVKKEVSSDFLKLFQGKTKHAKYSIGLHFWYIDREAENQRVSVSLKTSQSSADHFYMSEELSVADFKAKLLAVVPQLEGLGREDTFNTFQAAFPMPQRKHKLK